MHCARVEARRPGLYRRLAAACLLAALGACVWLASPPAHAVTAADAKAKAAQLKRLRARIEQLRGQLSVHKDEQSTAQQALQAVEKRIADSVAGLRKTVADMAAQQQQLEALHARQKRLQSDLNRNRGRLAQQVRASYAMGRQGQLKILLNQGDPATVERALVYYDYLNRSRSRIIHEAVAQLDQLQAVEQSIQERTQALKDLQARQLDEKRQLESDRRARESVLAALNKEIHDKGLELNNLVHDEQQLQRVLKAVEQALSDVPLPRELQQPFSALRGRLSWPTGGRIIAHFGSPRVTGSLRWRGVLISAAAGEPVHAIAHGRVAFADWLRGYGFLLIIDHGNGFMTLYGHNQSLYKEVGEWVQPGEVIASVGSSGGQAESGLYFEIRRQGTPINPMKWCKAARGNLVSWNR